MTSMGCGVQSLVIIFGNLNQVVPTVVVSHRSSWSCDTPSQTPDTLLHQIKKKEQKLEQRKFQ